MQPDNSIPVIEITDITKTYQMGETQVHALKGITLAMQPGEYTAIIGASGSGKSTLMNMIGLLDQPTGGSYRIRGPRPATEQEPHGRPAQRRDRLRLPELQSAGRTVARRQVELPLFYARVPSRKASKMAAEALAKVGLGDRTGHRPDELSGGQQQRVAIARALVNNPSLLLADEPTGALDSKTGEDVMALFKELHDQGLTLVVVTHDMGVARQAERIITLKDGEVIGEPTGPNRTPLTVDDDSALNRSGHEWQRTGVAYRHNCECEG